MRKWIYSVVLGILSSTAFGLNVCESTYALCTSAVCEPMLGYPDKVNCICEVKSGYSAAQKVCQKLKETDKGALLYSRYYPIHGYKICSNDRSWAYCLDAPCMLDKNDPEKATCLCSLVKNKGNYVLVTDKKIEASCESGIFSSATIGQVQQITDFLKTKDELTPFEIKVQN